MTTSIIVITVVLGLATVPLLWFIGREIRKSHELFQMLASRLNATVTKLPFGIKFELEGVGVRVYTLQGSLQYRARVHLREDPGILVTRTFRRFEFLDRLQYSPGRQKYLFHSPVDEKYGFRSKDSRWVREIFNHDLSSWMTGKGRVMRIDIRKRAVRGSMLMLNHSEAEHEKVRQSIEILNDVVLRVLKSSLSKPV